VAALCARGRDSTRDIWARAAARAGADARGRPAPAADDRWPVAMAAVPGPLVSELVPDPLPVALPPAEGVPVPPPLAARTAVHSGAESSGSPLNQPDSRFRKARFRARAIP